MGVEENTVKLLPGSMVVVGKVKVALVAVTGKLATLELVLTRWTVVEVAVDQGKVVVGGEVEPVVAFWG